MGAKRSAFVVETDGLVTQDTELSQARPGVHDLPQFADPSALDPREEGLVDLDAPTGWKNPEKGPRVHAGHEHTARDDSRSLDDIDQTVT